MNDEELRRRFEDLKRGDRRRAPDFPPMWRAARPARARGRLVASAASLAVAATLVVWLGARMTSPAAPPQAAAPPMAPPPLATSHLEPLPLDFLLEIREGTAAAVSASALDSNPLDGW